MVKGVFDELAKPAPKNHFTVGIDRRCHQHPSGARPELRQRAGQPVPGHLLRPGLRRHRRGEQELHQDHRRGHRQPRPGLLRLRLQEGRRPHRLATSASVPSPSAPPIWSTGRLRRLPRVVLPRALQDPAAGAGRGRPTCSTSPTRPRRSGTGCPTRARPASSSWVSRSTPSTPTRWPKKTGMGGRINTIMQTCFFYLSGIIPPGRGHRRHQGGHQEDLRQARRQGRREELQRRGPGHRQPARDHGPDDGHEPRGTSPRWCPRRPRSSSRT